MSASLYKHAISKSPGWKFGLHQCRADATNAQVWRSSKLRAAERASPKTIVGGARCWALVAPVSGGRSPSRAAER
eukprot:380988-Pyramimonas_sp.AAC.1